MVVNVSASTLTLSWSLTNELSFSVMAPNQCLSFVDDGNLVNAKIESTKRLNCPQQANMQIGVYTGELYKSVLNLGPDSI